MALLASVLASAAACGGSSSNGGADTSGGSPQHPSALVGTVGKNDAFTISLTDDAGTDITNLVAGTYQLTVHDDSSIHNFHLSGGGIDDKTSVTKSEVQTYTIAVKAGTTYTFVCDIHPQMKGSFTAS